MNQPIHADVLLVMLNDLVQRRVSGVIDELEYAKQAEPINSELSKRINEKTDQNEQRLAKLERGLQEIQRMSKKNDEHYRDLQQLYQENEQRYRSVIERYEEFLQMKGQAEEFEEWEFQQLEAGRDG